jgi:hypothetical protein
LLSMIGADIELSLNKKREAGLGLLFRDYYFSLS